MATSVVMPALDPGQATGVLVRWLKREGEAVSAGEPLMEIETDKAVMEVEATASGVLAGVSAEEGEEIPVGRVIAFILAPGESLPSPLPGSGGATEAQPPPTVQGIPAARSGAPSPDDRGGLQPQGGDQRPLASPRARRLAAERGIDLGALQGSGPGGAVTSADLEASGHPPAPSSPAASPLLPRAWRLMAERMATSWSSAPHFFLTREVEASALAEARKRLVAASQGGAGPTYTDMLVKLTATALRRHPNLNARWADGHVKMLPDVNVGIATATATALLVPVIHRADTLTVAEVAARRGRLVELATAGRLGPEDVADGTFTLSNLGMYGVDAFTAIINPPQAAILAVGALKDRVIPVGGQPAVRPTMILTLSCDHRVVDGARAARFLDDLVSLIQEPSILSG